MSSSISKNIELFVNTFIEERKKAYYNSNAEFLIKNNIVKELKEIIKDDNYRLKGSVGNGRFAEIPWIGIYNKEIDSSPTKGLYLVLLFTSDLKGLYLSLNQGYSFLKNKYGTKRGKEIAGIVSRYIRNSSFNIPEKYLISIDLKATHQLAKGYEAANIYSKYYEIESLPDDVKFAIDIKSMLQVYEEIVLLMNGRKNEEFYNYIIAMHKGQIVENEAEREKIDYLLEKRNIESHEPKYNNEPINKSLIVKDYIGAEHYPRNSKIAANALVNAKFNCEYDDSHKHFTRKSNNRNYTESHHLIPLSQHKDFEYSLDVEENICSLCSVCNDCVHYGTDEEKKKILKKLYNMRKELLEKVGLKISFDELKNYYFILNQVS